MPLPSASTYIQALREEHFLEFLQWGPALAKSNPKIIAEDLINMVSYSWMLSGFKEEDFQKMVLIEGVMNHKDCPVRGLLAYTATFLINAALQCKIYLDNEVHLKALENIGPDGIDVIAYMNQVNDKTEFNFTDELTRQRDEMNTLLGQKLQSKKVVKIIDELSKLLTPQNLISVYVDRLEATLHTNPDINMAIRLGVSQAFKEDLAKASDNPDLIAKFVNLHSETLRGLGMQSWELEYIEGISPAPLGQRVWSKFRGLAHPFFQALPGKTLEPSKLSEDEESSTDFNP